MVKDSSAERAGWITHTISARMGAKVNEHLVITRKGEKDIDIMAVPYQHLPGLIEEVYTASRTAALSGTKTNHRCLNEIDKKATRSIYTKLEPEDRGIFRKIQGGGGMARAEAYEMGAQPDPICRYCGHQ